MEENKYTRAQERMKETVKREFDSLHQFLLVLEQIHLDFQRRPVDDEVHEEWLQSYREHVMGAFNCAYETIDVTLWNQICNIDLVEKA